MGKNQAVNPRIRCVIHSVGRNSWRAHSSTLRGKKVRWVWLQSPAKLENLHWPQLASAGSWNEWADHWELLLPTSCRNQDSGSPR